MSPLEVDCPTCGAKGTPEDAPKRYRCRTLKTNRSTDAHVERWYARWPELGTAILTHALAALEDQ